MIIKQTTILGGNKISSRINPSIEDGRLASVNIEIEGVVEKEALGVIEASNLYFGIEGSHNTLGSDWNFARFELEIFQRIKTFYKRRLIPNVLDVKIMVVVLLGKFLYNVMEP